MEAKSVSSHWGAHHGPQSDIVNGTNAYEYPGKRYSSSPHKDVLPDGCVTCHMSLPEGRYSFSPEVGGHSFNIVGEVHESEKVNVSGCIGCHEGIKQLPGTDMFDIKAKADYDRDGTVEAGSEGLGLRRVWGNAPGCPQKDSRCGSRRQYRAVGDGVPSPFCISWST